MNKNTIGYISLVLVLFLASSFSINLFFREKDAHDKLNIASFPFTVGEWKGTNLEVTEKEYRILETRNLILRKYTNTRGENIFLFIIYSETNRSVFHPPEVCLIGSGLTILDKQQEKEVSKLYVEKNGSKELVLYCYKAGNFYTSNYYLQQAYLALHQIFGKRIPGATIRVSMPMTTDEKTTLAALKMFLTKTTKIFDSLT